MKTTVEMSASEIKRAIEKESGLSGRGDVVVEIVHVDEGDYICINDLRAVVTVDPGAPFFSDA